MGVWPASEWWQDRGSGVDGIWGRDGWLGRAFCNYAYSDNLNPNPWGKRTEISQWRYRVESMTRGLLFRCKFSSFSLLQLPTVAFFLGIPLLNTESYALEILILAG